MGAWMPRAARKATCAVMSALSLMWLAPMAPAQAADGKPGQAALAASSADVPAQYKAVDLATWVPAVRTPGRIILQPSGVSFVAAYQDGPRAQKTDYLQQALRVMRVSAPPKVSQAVLLRYGPADGQTLVAYIDEAAATRLRKELRPGDRRQFFAFHVYNYAKGPALVITSFGPTP